MQKKLREIEKKSHLMIDFSLLFAYNIFERFGDVYAITV